VSAQVREAENSFLARFVGKKDPGLKLSRDDWDKLAGKIEGIISGLESVLAKKLAGRAPPPH
jgi:hypothetical protein